MTHIYRDPPPRKPDAFRGPKRPFKPKDLYHPIDPKAQIEVVNFYPSGIEKIKKGVLGSLHVYFCNLGIHLRGIKITRKGKQVKALFPFQKVIDAKGKMIKFPVMEFNSVDLKKQMIKEVVDKYLKFVEANKSLPLPPASPSAAYIPKKA